MGRAITFGTFDPRRLIQNQLQDLFTILNRGLFNPAGYANAERPNGKSRISSQRNNTEKVKPRIPISRKRGPNAPRQQPCMNVAIDNEWPLRIARKKSVSTASDDVGLCSEAR
jgi:hypothetical protein